MDSSPVDVIHTSLQTLLISHTFLVLLVPLLVALFYYSTPCSRRKPIFILNIISLAVALGVAAFGDAMTMYILLSPQRIWAEELELSFIFMGNFQMMLVDSILFVRLITVYPLARVGLWRFLLLTFLPIILKVVRVVNTILFIHHLVQIVKGPNGYMNAEIAWHLLPYEKIEWVAQMVDNSYASIVFLLAIRISSVRPNSDGFMSVTASRQSSVARRLRTLFRLALSNFIIPTVTSAVQLVMLFQLGNGVALNLNNIPHVNAMVAVFGVVFATVWAGEEHRREDKAMTSPPVTGEQHRMYLVDGGSDDAQTRLPLPASPDQRSGRFSVNHLEPVITICDRETMLSRNEVHLPV